MAWIDHRSFSPPPGRLRFAHLPGWALVASASALICLMGFAARGFGDNGLRLGSELAWRFTFLIYFAAVTAGPLTRLVPSRVLRRICDRRRQLIWGFCASFAVYLASVLVPNTTPLSPERDATGASVFILFGAALILVIAYAAGDGVALFLGERAKRTLLGVGLSTFWLIYAAAGLAHISGPHRPDVFYGVSLGLMIAALLLRFADSFATGFRRPDVS